eukprot:6064182-Pleurochrysis_carterae.AAC.1
MRQQAALAVRWRPDLDASACTATRAIIRAAFRVRESVTSSFWIDARSASHESAPLPGSDDGSSDGTTVRSGLAGDGRQLVRQSNERGGGVMRARGARRTARVGGPCGRRSGRGRAGSKRRRPSSRGGRLRLTASKSERASALRCAGHGPPRAQPAMRGRGGWGRWPGARAGYVAN